MVMSENPTKMPKGQKGNRRGRGRPFVKGQSGNPAGRPKGARNRASLIAEELLDGKAEAVFGKLIELACAGNIAALRLCTERLSPKFREPAVHVELKPIHSVEDATAAMAGICDA